MKREIADHLMRLLDEYDPWSDDTEFAIQEMCRSYLERFSSPRIPFPSEKPSSED